MLHCTVQLCRVLYCVVVWLRHVMLWYVMWCCCSVVYVGVWCGVVLWCISVCGGAWCCKVYDHSVLYGVVFMLICR